MPYGYNGKILVVDLAKGTCSIDEHSEAWYRTYWGGGCLASYYMHKLIPANADPYGENNILVFSSSVVSGIPFSGFSRYTTACLNPMTGGFGESEAGGYFGPAMKHAGFDALVFKGISPKPVYLYLNQGEFELRDASHVWGMENAPLYDQLRSETNPKARIASIGPAGENMVRYACVINELAHANGRSGTGAVMGSKKLKAVVAFGDANSIEYANPEKLKELNLWHRTEIKNHLPTQNMGKFGTVQHLMAQQSGGVLPVRNWQDSVWDDAEKIGWDGYKEVYAGQHTCYRCTVACKRKVTNNVSDKRYGGAEYETLAAYGSMTCVSNIDHVTAAHERSNALGIDTVSGGATIAFAMELVERGILKDDDFAGVYPKAVNFGDGEGMLALIEAIATKTGIGADLAEGSKRLAEKIGQNTIDYTIQIKGQEVGYHDPRGKTGVGLGFAVSPTGGDHVEAPHESPFQGEGVRMIRPWGVTEAPKALELGEPKARYFVQAQKTWAMNNTLSICNFVIAPLFTMTYAKLIEVVEATTGWVTSLEELFLVGERSIVLARMFNIKNGIINDDVLFERLYSKITDGPAKGNFIDREEFQKTLDIYYAMSGYDENGIPSKGTLQRLDIAWVAE